MHTHTHTNTHIIPPANTSSIPRAGSFIKIHRPFGKFSVCNKSTSMETLVDPPHGWGCHCASHRPVPSHWYVVIVVKCCCRASGFDLMDYLQANRSYDRKQTWRVRKFAAVAFTDEQLCANKQFYRTTFTGPSTKKQHCFCIYWVLSALEIRLYSVGDCTICLT